MPIYEYRCEDGETIELLRPMSEADRTVPDPKGKGRTFKRVLSTFAVSGASVNVAATHKHTGPGCGCGNPHGPCNS
jgi:putative FmdB family regulatory protein